MKTTTTIFRLKDIEAKIDLGKIMAPRYKIMKGIYARVKDGILFIVGTASLNDFDINFLKKLFTEKLKDQKKGLSFNTAVFWYAV